MNNDTEPTKSRDAMDQKIVSRFHDIERQANHPLSLSSKPGLGRRHRIIIHSTKFRVCPPVCHDRVRLLRGSD